MKPSIQTITKIEYRINPLVIQNCPKDLGELPEGATFGDTTLKLVEVAKQYHKCREAALADSKDSEDLE